MPLETELFRSTYSKMVVLSYTGVIVPWVRLMQALASHCEL